MNSWKLFADFFGPRYYIVFIIFIGNNFLLLACMTAAWTSPVLVKLKSTEDNPLGRPISENESGLIGSLFYVGAALGPLSIISSVEHLGRKALLSTISLIVPTAYGILAVAKTVEWYYLCRIALGFSAGATFSMQPVYISEMIAAKDRGFYMSFITFFSVGGLLISYSIGPFLSLYNFNFFIAIFSLSIIIFFAFCCPESPYYVMKEKGKTEARELLKKIRKDDIAKELEEIEQTIAEKDRESFSESLNSTKCFKPFVMATIPLLLQQYSGITVLVTYSQSIFLKTKVSIPSDQCSVIVACLQLLTAFLTPTLLKKKIPRKFLLILSLILVSASNFVMGFYFIYADTIFAFSWLPLVGLIIFVISYNVGLDAIPWMLVGEFYPMKLKSLGPAISTSIFSLSVFPILFSFHRFNIGYLFFCFGCICAVGFLYVKVFIAETQGKSLREIHKSIS